jgi:hypothetical protein
MITTVKNTKFIVKVQRSGNTAPQYLQMLDRMPFRTTPNLKLALAMGRFTAEDAMKSLQTSRCTLEILPVQVTRKSVSH